MHLSYYRTIYYKMLYYKNVFVNILNNVQFILNVNISIEYIKHYEFLCERFISKNIYQNKAKSR